MITPDHFLVRPYVIPSIEEESEDIQAFIDLWEEKLLRQLLGETFYTDLVDGLADDPIAAKWTQLKSGGVTYEYAGSTYNYDGLVNLLVPAIFEQWLRENHENVSASGITRHIKDKTDYINPSRRICEAHNDFAKRVGGSCAQEDSFYGYVYSRYTDYVSEFSVWQFKQPSYLNEFGI